MVFCAGTKAKGFADRAQHNRIEVVWAHSENSKMELPISFDELREKTLESFKLMNSVIFPIKFPVRI